MNYNCLYYNYNYNNYNKYILKSFKKLSIKNIIV